jgi:hypothetical protein
MQEKTPLSKPSDLGFSEAVSSLFSDVTTKVAAEATFEKEMTALGIVNSMHAIGREWVLWEPETIWSEAKRVFSSPLSELSKSKIEAVKTLLVSNAFWADHLVFEKVCVALNDAQPVFDQYQHPSPAMLALAVAEAATIRKASFSDEVLGYMAAVCFDAGLIVLPKPLDVAQEALDELTRPVVGRQLKEEVSRAWEASRVNGAASGLYTETVTGIQLARMAAIAEYAGAA